MRFVLWPKMWSTLVYVSWALEKICILLLLGGVFCKCWLGPVGWWSFEFFYILVDFLSSCSLNCWVSRVEVPNNNCVFVYLSFQFCLFCFTYFAAVMFNEFIYMIAMSSDWIDFYQYIISLSGNFLFSEVYFICANQRAYIIVPAEWAEQSHAWAIWVNI